MPAGFDNCRAAGGRIVTASGPDKHYGLKSGEYVHICILHGQFHRGDVKTKTKQDMHSTSNHQMKGK